MWTVGGEEQVVESTQVMTLGVYGPCMMRNRN